VSAKHKHNYLRLFLTGFGMGSADIVPGVSGGTIAFIFGVYEELIFSIKKISSEVLKLVFKMKYKEAVAATPLHFLVPLGLGILTAIATLSGFISHFLETQPTLIWSFFFGLLVASVYVVRKRVRIWDKKKYKALIVSALLAFYIAGLVPVATSATPIAFFLSGMVAIIAMILPGVSGSFFLILMGKYEQVLHAVVSRDIVTIAIFGVGAVVGLALFSRVLSWLFKNHHDIVVASLTGFMIGSLRKVWPWKIGELNALPVGNAEIIRPLALMLLGAVLIYYLDSKHVVETEVHDVDDPAFEREHAKAKGGKK